MRWLFLLVSLIGLLVFSTLEPRQVYHKSGELESGLVTTSGFLKGSQLCGKTCIKLVGVANRTGGVTVTGQFVKKQSGGVLFVQRIE